MDLHKPPVIQYQLNSTSMQVKQFHLAPTSLLPLQLCKPTLALKELICWVGGNRVGCRMSFKVIETMTNL